MADSAVKIPFVEAAAPATPAAGEVVIYAKSDGLLYSKDDAGTETLVSGGAGGGSVATDAIWDAKGDLAGGTGANTAARLPVGSNGLVLVAASGEATGLKWSYPRFVGAKGTRATTQAITTATWTGVEMIVADTLDTDAFHDTGSNPSRFTVPAGLGGIYQVNILAAFAANATGSRYCVVYKNGSQYGEPQRTPGHASIPTYVQLSDLVSLAATDYIECMVHQDSGGNLNVTLAALSMALVGV